MRRADEVLPVLLPRDQRLAEAPRGAAQHHRRLGEQVGEPPHDKVQLPLPAGLDVDLPGGRDVRAVLGGRPAGPCNGGDGREARRMEKGRRRKKRVNTGTSERERRGRREGERRDVKGKRERKRLEFTWAVRGSGYQLRTIKPPAKQHTH